MLHKNSSHNRKSTSKARKRTSTAIKKEINAGFPKKQAIAIGLSKSRGKRKK